MRFNFYKIEKQGNFFIGLTNNRAGCAFLWILKTDGEKRLNR
jgi:hypothetical protein